MDIDGFWVLIEESGRAAKTKKKRLAWLDAHLRERTAEEIVDFQMWLDVVQTQAATWELWGAYFAVFGMGSDDGFEYFRRWLQGLGRETFERVVADPDSLIEVPELLRLLARKGCRWTNEEWPEFEQLSYVAWDPYKAMTGLEIEHLFSQVGARGVATNSSELRGEQWTIDSWDDMRHRFPRIARYWEGRSDKGGSK
ncbi:MULTISPECIES: DUF4240 domain-containing protein [Nonomuraea]|uniref:DUF4240 domain-containing protein n=1 Tax=Nonomuraea mangrovi TaxID=2316207 RepID=A0ABW4SZ20_9ACTN